MATDASIFGRMLKYCDDAVKYAAGAEYEDFIKNELHLTFSAFSLSQLGEMAGRLGEDFSAKYPQIPWRAIRGMRNRIVHDYDNVTFATL